MERTSDADEALKGSVDSEVQATGKKCYICLKGFNFRKKHICKFCYAAVCSDHCQRSRQKEPDQEPQPICDICLQNEIKKEIESELKGDIFCLEEELKQAKLVNNRLERDHFEKTSSVSKLEHQLEGLAAEYDKKIKALEQTLQIEELEAKEIVELYTKTEAGLKNSRAQVVEIDEKIVKGKIDLEATVKQMENLKETKEGLNQQLDRINEKLKGSLAIERVEALLCEPCRNKMKEAAQRRREMPSILEDATVCLSAIEERQSVLESVREYKEILEKQNSNPSENAGCLIY